MAVCRISLLYPLYMLYFYKSVCPKKSNDLFLRESYRFSLRGPETRLWSKAAWVLIPALPVPD